MTEREKIERLENKLKEALSWWRATEKQLSQKCKETKANQKTIERLKAENAALRERLEKAVELPFIHKFHIEDTKGNAVTLYQLVYIDDDNSITTEIDNSEERTEARLAVLKGGRE